MAITKLDKMSLEKLCTMVYDACDKVTTLDQADSLANYMQRLSVDDLKAVHDCVQQFPSLDLRIGVQRHWTEKQLWSQDIPEYSWTWQYYYALLRTFHRILPLVNIGVRNEFFLSFVAFQKHEKEWEFIEAINYSTLSDIRQDFLWFCNLHFRELRHLSICVEISRECDLAKLASFFFALKHLNSASLHCVRKVFYLFIHCQRENYRLKKLAYFPINTSENEEDQPMDVDFLHNGFASQLEDFKVSHTPSLADYQGHGMLRKIILKYPLQDLEYSDVFSEDEDEFALIKPTGFEVTKLEQEGLWSFFALMDHCFPNLEKIDLIDFAPIFRWTNIIQPRHWHLLTGLKIAVNWHEFIDTVYTIADNMPQLEDLDIRRFGGHIPLGRVINDVVAITSLTMLDSLALFSGRASFTLLAPMIQMENLSRLTFIANVMVDVSMHNWRACGDPIPDRLQNNLTVCSRLVEGDELADVETQLVNVGFFAGFNFAWGEESEYMMSTVAEPGDNQYEPGVIQELDDDQDELGDDQDELSGSQDELSGSQDDSGDNLEEVYREFDSEEDLIER